MCEFKNCPGVHACLLRKSSPCPGAVQSAPKGNSSRRAGVSQKGFLNRDALFAVLGQEARAEMDKGVELVRLAGFSSSDTVGFAT